ncbi:MAG: hypothetical protein COS92_01355 [Desulfobacterales bacterium CG07_land_8_20_14_0_80_52_14]|nr:MAG: hypothetical protein COX20_11535 [Desulfobacterales bacterium CG23_combo_of_CG06-09_8_20_14_all_52_9]PIU50440.1 MAG: hypothetical protein COS92_01355 [Desulfobacterales bacterium CG07_land_8_20_14_0_80_52_14]
MKKYHFVTVFDLLIEYIRDKKIRLDKSRFKDRMATYHDPCNYGRQAQRHFGHGFFEEPRWILSQCMDHWRDLYPCQMNQICCGGGGGTLTTGYNEERIFYARRKFDQIRTSGADMLVVPCHSCHGQFNAVKKEYGMETLEVKYLWELVADCLVVG